MGTKISKWIKIVLCIVGLAALLVLSNMLGIRIERNRRKAMELQKEHVSTIAVVNMDNGVMVENEQINYASQLISFPNEHFVVTGLADAKAGIENGTYAAYVVIPETFSTSVTSIENDPRKVTLVYQYNNMLVEEAEIQAVNDVNTFIALLNSNIAYMYMDAIMAEFHRIQDDSSTILANDNMEMERLASVNAANLIVSAEPVEEIEVSNDIESVELTTYTTRNNDLLDSMLLGYSDAVQMGKDDYASIHEENTGVQTATDNFIMTYDTVIQDTIDGQSELLTTGRDKLAEAVGLYNQSVDEQETEVRNIIADIINMQLEADKSAAEAQLQQILEDLSGQIDSVQEDTDSEDIAVSGIQETVSGNQLSEPLTPEGEEYYEIILTAFDDEEALNNTVTDTLDLFKMESESEQISEVLQMYFVDALSAESQVQMSKLTDEKLLLNQSMEDYETLLVNYDPMQYIENADLDTYVYDIGSNAGDMLGAVEENNSDYMSYATEMYTNTTEYTNQVRNSLDEANTQTVENIEDCVDELILSRTNINNQNVSILGEFPNALGYTRVESQGNTEVYDCIVNPVVSQINGQAVAVTNAAEPNLKKDNSIKIWLVLVLGIGIMLFLIEAVISFRQQYRELREESE